MNEPLCVFVCVAESVASKASHCDPDSKCSPEREREREREAEMVGDIERE